MKYFDGGIRESINMEITQEAGYDNGTAVLPKAEEGLDRLLELNPVAATQPVPTATGTPTPPSRTRTPSPSPSPTSTPSPQTAASSTSEQGTEADPAGIPGLAIILGLAVLIPATLIVKEIIAYRREREE